MPEDFSAVGGMMGFFFFVILVFAAAYYVTRFVGKRFTVPTLSTKEIRVIDRLALGRDRYLLIVEAGGKALLLGVGAQHIETLAELERGSFAGTGQAEEGADFLALLKSRLRKPGAGSAGAADSSAGGDSAAGPEAGGGDE